MTVGLAAHVHACCVVRLTELGPRLSLQLVKVEEGICDGPIMYHSFVSKTQAELAQQQAAKEKKK